MNQVFCDLISIILDIFKTGNFIHNCLLFVGCVGLQQIDFENYLGIDRFQMWIFSIFIINYQPLPIVWRNFQRQNMNHSLQVQDFEWSVEVTGFNVDFHILDLSCINQSFELQNIFIEFLSFLIICFAPFISIIIIILHVPPNAFVVLRLAFIIFFYIFVIESEIYYQILLSHCVLCFYFQFQILKNASINCWVVFQTWYFDFYLYSYRDRSHISISIQTIYAN